MVTQPMSMDMKLAEFIQQHPDRKVVFFTDNDENLGWCRTFHDVSSWKLAEVVMFKEVFYNDEDEFINAYVEQFWEEDSGDVNEAAQDARLRKEAKIEWDCGHEDIIAVYTDWWAPREV